MLCPWDLNPWPLPYQCSALLPTELTRTVIYLKSVYYKILGQAKFQKYFSSFSKSSIIINSCLRVHSFLMKLITDRLENQAYFSTHFSSFLCITITCIKFSFFQRISSCSLILQTYLPMTARNNMAWWCSRPANTDPQSVSGAIRIMFVLSWWSFRQLFNGQNFALCCIP